MTHARFPGQIIRWTETELEHDIESIEKQLLDDQPAVTGKTWARSYLKQVLKDRRSTLRLLRRRNKDSETATLGRSAAPASWLPTQPQSKFQAYLRP